jgi:glycosyltransferase involved in cell wall biosynthesis
MPHFSIIIPTYNRAGRIEKTIHAVLGQTVEDFELIIVDDGSTDNTAEIVKSIPDERIRYSKKKNEERAIARNFGIERAHGKYVTFLDSDDLLYPQCLEEAQKMLKIHKNPEWFHLAYEVKDENGSVLRRENERRGNVNNSLITGNHLSCIGVFVREDIIKMFRFHEDRDIIGSEDYLLWLDLACRFPLRYSNRISAAIIQHQARSVVNFNNDQLVRRIEKSIEIVVKNPCFQKEFMEKQHVFKAHRYLYLANHLSRASYKSASIKYYLKSIRSYSPIAIHRNSFSYFRSILF